MILMTAVLIMIAVMMMVVVVTATMAAATPPPPYLDVVGQELPVPRPQQRVAGQRKGPGGFDAMIINNTPRCFASMRQAQKTGVRGKRRVCTACHSPAPGRSPALCSWGRWRAAAQPSCRSACAPCIIMAVIMAVERKEEGERKR